MDEILPGLWVGGVRAAMDADYLSRAGITHIITCMKQQIPVPPALPPDGRIIARSHMKHVRIDDEEKAPILVHFAGCNEFISSQLEEEWLPDPPTSSSSHQNSEVEKEEEEGDQVELLVQGRQQRFGKWGTWQTTGTGTVLVHCQAGCSRSVAIVAAYLMQTRQVSASVAIQMISKRRKDAEPNKGFRAQLELYQQVGYEIDMKWQAVRRFLMSKTDILNGDSMDDMLLSYYPSPYPSPALSAAAGAAAGMKGFTTINATTTTTTINDNDGETSTLDQEEALKKMAAEKKSKLISKNPQPLSRSPSSSSSSSTISSGYSSVNGRITSNLSSISPTIQTSTLQNLSNELSHFSMANTPASTIADTSLEVKVTASGSNRLPGGVSQIRGHENVDKRGLLPKPNFKGPKLRCKGCRRELAALDHVVIHEPGKGQLAFDHRKRDVGHVGSNVVGGFEGVNGGGEGGLDSKQNNAEQNGSQEETAKNTKTTTTTLEPAEDEHTQPPTKKSIQTPASLASQLPPHLAALRTTRPQPKFPPLPPSSSSTTTITTTSTPSQSSTTISSMLKSPSCSSYFLEPMAWMSSLSSGQVTGKLNCPSPKCGQKLGSWDWAGMQCACGAWVTPAFSLHRSKVDEV